MNLLVIEDDRKLNRMLCEILEKEGYTVKACTDGEEGAYYLQQNAYDLALVDWMLPGESGPDILRESRRKGIMTPVVMLTALTAVENKVTCLDAGADDYLTKPFSIDEFLARLRVALRRSQTEGAAGEESSVYVNGRLKIDYAAGCVYIGDTEIHLTPIEYKLLCLLAQNTGKVLTHNFILREVWGSELESDIPSLRVFMATLRKKIEQDSSSPQYIQTHIGVGYRMIKQ